MALIVAILVLSRSRCICNLTNDVVKKVELLVLKDHLLEMHRQNPL